MYKIRTSIDDIDRARFLARAIVETHSAVSIHIKEIENIYAWEGKVSHIVEYELTGLCLDPQKVLDVVKDYSYYQMPELIIEEVKVYPEIEKWCNDWCNIPLKNKKGT